MHSHITPLFSIITVTYHAESVLEETILSVVSQTYHNIEYIIVDGASKDRTLSIVNKYRDKIQAVVSEPDKGLYDAMNKGLKMAKGEYVCFLNAGDTFHEDDTLQLIVHQLNKSNVLPDVIYGETALVDAQRHFVRMRRLQTPDTLNWKSFRQGMLVCHQAFIAKRALAETYDLNYRFSADFDWCIRVMKKASLLHNTRLTLIDYLDEGMTTKNRKASLKERFRIMAKHYGYISTVLHHIWFVLRLLLKPGQ
ncbi:MAG: glycosyltransferase family 2 protein [Bacteroides graminisolvens]|jgi:glycosyltransferase involved in cell wall biosynthesis|uniref:glycosyltransferase family 2 protein n=1 Tax=Bacteroides TaxID=816 RepID=UPI000E87EFC6|nr:glycosyltransferase family 2 protein [Bacteroides graminisolvens]MBP5978276.1 glycosyltransferase [Bacteroides sp.]MBP6139913.1 glycosyltransferase [Bacteroides sp.]MBP6248383.1 glycosyltransferase [Bacteroides sp.]MBP6980374.1 glycosyltransferase [Bacteroides sp.]MBP7293301.1 glycosyltransferase [Bacteroides sp.]